MKTASILPEFTWSGLVENFTEVNRALLHIGGMGAVKITASANEQSLALQELKTITLNWADTIGEPIVVYKRKGLWKQIGVSLEAEPDRAGGVGDIPLHIDLVNASLPPDFVVFLCECSAGAGRGQSVVSPFRPALRALSTQAISDLGKIYIREGRFFDLVNVGEEKNPFPLLDLKAQEIEWIRYTGKAKVSLAQGSEEAFIIFGSALRSGEIEFELSSKDAFIVNQRLAAHGRRSLQLDQRLSPVVPERSLWQLFVRGHDHLLNKCLV